MRRRISGARGAPASGEDLSSNHTLIVYGETAAPEIRDVNWLIDTTRGFRPAAYARAAHQQHHRHPACGRSGRGHRGAARLCRGGRPNLVRILPEVEGPTFDVHLVYCDALRQSKRVAAFRDFLVRAAKDWKY
jgi:DNA-binding transcriptional LysR family regulator